MIKNSIIKSIANKISRLLDTDRFYIALYDPIKEVLNFPYSIDNKKIIKWPSRQFNNNLFPDVSIKNKETMLFEDNVLNSLKEKNITYWPHSKQPLSCLSVPMIAENNVVGLIVVENTHKSKAFGNNGVRILNTIARMAAMAILKNSLYNKLNRNNKSLQILNEMGLILTSNINLSKTEILELIYTQASKLMDTNNMYVALYDQDPNKKDIFKNKNPHENKIYGTISFLVAFVEGKPVDIRPRKAGYGRTETIIRDKQPILIKTRDESIEWYQGLNRQEYIGEPFASWLGVPMMKGDKIIGVVATYHTKNNYVYDENDLQILSMLANQAAVAIENIKSYKKIESKLILKEQQKNALTELLALNDLTGRFVHKVNNMAGNIPLTIEFIEEHLNERGVKDNVLMSDLMSIKRKVQNLIDIANRIQESTQKLENGDSKGLKKVNVISLLEKAIFQTSAGIDSKKFWEKYQIVKEYLDSSLFIETFETIFTEALSNLMSNAVESMPEGGILTLRTYKQQINGSDYAIVTIKDTGKGIPKNDYDKIYDINYSKRSGGLGYGLWLVKRICVATGTDINFISIEEKGTEFFLKIPL